jgi:hypothetical protein
MEAHRFDRLSKSLARWTSRRRFFAGLAGGALGGLAGSGGMRAQGPELEEPPEPDPEALAFIAERSAESRGYIPDPDAPEFVEPGFDPRIPEFFRLLRSLGDFGENADGRISGTPWNGYQLSGFLRTITLVPLSVSAGSDAYLDRFADERLAAQCPDVQAATEGEAPERTSDCTTPCCEKWKQDYDACASGDAVCLTEAFWSFIECFGFGKNADPCDPPSSVCLGRIMRGCGTDCRL